MPAAMLTLIEPVAERIEAGMPVHLHVRIDDPAAAALPVVLRDEDGQLLASATPSPDTDGQPVALLEATAPARLGEHRWQVALDGAPDASPLDIAVVVVPQRTMLNSWGTPPVVGARETFPVTVGAKSAAAANLSDFAIEVRDAAGELVATGRLGNTPWPGTEALYWTTLQIPAPNVAGPARWEATLAATDKPIPLAAASARFGVAVSAGPHHAVRLTVTDQETGDGLASAHVRIGIHRAVTDASGIARLSVAAGTHPLAVSRDGYETHAGGPVSVDGDSELSVALVPLPDDEGKHWTY